MVRRWSWLAVLLVGALLFGAVWGVLTDTGNPNLVPALILLGSMVIPATFVTFVAGQRVRYSVGIGAVATVAMVGGVVGVVLAGMLEYDTLKDLGTLPMVGVGVIEETAKLLAPAAALLVLRRRRAPADGLLIGVAAGAGFAVLETMGYALVVLVRSGGSIAALDDVLLMRGAMSPAAHMAWTGITSAALWAAAAHGWRGRSILWFLVGFAVAVALHTMWDSANTTWVYVVLGVISLGTVLTAALLLHGQRRLRWQTTRLPMPSPA